MAVSPWRIEDQQVALAWRGLQARLNLARPDLGLSVESFDSAPLSSVAVLGVVFPAVAQDVAQCDAYTRVSDLVATYPVATSRPFRVQAYWRCVADPLGDDVAALAIDLQLSVQTPLLDCTPVVHTRTQLNQTAALQRAHLRTMSLHGDASLVNADAARGGEVFTARLAESPRPIQYIEMIHASDLQSHRLDAHDACWRLEHDLFEPGLEKGVIRRVRVRGLFHAGAADEQLVERAYQIFHNAALPLTT